MELRSADSAWEEFYLADVNSDKRICGVCHVIKTKETYHWEDCGLCVIDYDHHCPWTGKCIGRDNLYFFNIFLGSLGFQVFLLCFVAIQGMRHSLTS